MSSDVHLIYEVQGHATDVTLILRAKLVKIKTAWFKENLLTINKYYYVRVYERVMFLFQRLLL